MNTPEKLPTLLSLLNYDAGKFTSAEAQLQNNLPRWIDGAGSTPLKSALDKYLGLVDEHIEKLDIFRAEENFLYTSQVNLIMHAFIKETDEKLAQCADADIKDACLRACMQNINHYKIATYDIAATFAHDLAMDDAVTVFRDLEIDEKQIDHRLSQLAEHETNANTRIPVWLSKAVHPVRLML